MESHEHEVIIEAVKERKMTMTKEERKKVQQNISTDLVKLYAKSVLYSGPRRKLTWSKNSMSDI